MFSWMRKSGSKDTLKDRLELVLAYDRANLEPGRFEDLRRDLLEVVERYFPTGHGQIEIEQKGKMMVLMANIPVDPSRSERRVNEVPPT